MKKSFKIVRVLLLVMVVVSFVGLFPTNAYAASKKKTKTTKTPEVQDETLAALTAYRDMLVAMGASEADINAANQAVLNRQAVLTYEAALKEQEEQAKKANEEAIKAQQTMLQQYYDALEQMTNPGKKKSKNSKETVQVPVTAGVIFVGDSRTVQMHGAVGETGAAYIAENSKGYQWFVDEAIPMINARVGKGSKIVINLGVNDPGNAPRYIETVNYWASVWTSQGAKVYYALVNPVSENPYTSQVSVDYMNEQLVNGLVGVTIIDTPTYLRTAGYVLVDGLHYNDATYQKLYSYLLSRL